MAAKKIVLLCFFFLLLSCNKEVNKANLAHLAGYWEISHVTMADGSRKDFKVNETIDHFTINGTSGCRRKMMPKLDGSYLTSGDSEKFEIRFTNSKAIVYYETPFAKWTEQLKYVSPDELIVENNKIIYHYKRPLPFTKK